VKARPYALCRCGTWRSIDRRAPSAQALDAYRRQPRPGKILWCELVAGWHSN